MYPHGSPQPSARAPGVTLFDQRYAACHVPKGPGTWPLCGPCWPLLALAGSSSRGPERSQQLSQHGGWMHLKLVRELERAWLVTPRFSTYLVCLSVAGFYLSSTTIISVSDVHHRLGLDGRASHLSSPCYLGDNSGSTVTRLLWCCSQAYGFKDGTIRSLSVSLSLSLSLHVWLEHLEIPLVCPLAENRYYPPFKGSQ